MALMQVERDINATSVSGDHAVLDNQSPLADLAWKAFFDSLSQVRISFDSYDKITSSKIIRKIIPVISAYIIYDALAGVPVLRD